MKVYDVLYFIISRTRRRYQRRREKADGVLLLRRGPLDDVYDALYAFCPSLDQLCCHTHRNLRRRLTAYIDSDGRDNTR